MGKLRLGLAKNLSFQQPKISIWTLGQGMENFRAASDAQCVVEKKVSPHLMILFPQHSAWVLSVGMMVHSIPLK